jgi:hypothetical protein
MKDKRRILTSEFASQMKSQSEEHEPNRAGYCEDAAWLDEAEVKGDSAEKIYLRTKPARLDTHFRTEITPAARDQTDNVGSITRY